MYSEYLTKGPVTGSAGEGPHLNVDRAHVADQMPGGSEVYDVYLTKGPVTGRAGKGPLSCMDRAHVVDQMAGCLELSAANRAQKTFLLLAALLVVPQQRVGKEHS
jgi:hypothetical protein